MKFINKLFLFLLVNTIVFANDYDYKLTPTKVAEDTYVFIGKKEFF